MPIRTVWASALAVAVVLAGCGTPGERVDAGPPPSTLRPPSTPAASTSTDEATTKPTPRRTYAMPRIKDNPCLLLDDHDRTELGVPLPGAWSKSDDGTRSCLWVVNGGYGVGVWTDKAVGRPSVLGGRPVRVRGHRATQFRRENGAVCYTVVAVKPKRWIVLVSDADSSPENRPRLCRVGKRFARAMVAHIG